MNIGIKNSHNSDRFCYFR